MGKIIQDRHGNFVDTEPVSPPDDLDVDSGVIIYAYASFRSLEHVAYGLFRTDGSPTDDEIESEQVGEYGMEPRAPFWEFADAMKELGKGNRRERRWIFEEVSLVEVSDEEEWEGVIAALDLPDRDADAFEGPGLYDFRDEPPTRSYKSVEEYELETLKYEADQAIDFMFQGDEWEAVYESLAEVEVEED